MKDEISNDEDVDLVLMQADRFDTEPQTSAGEYMENVSTSLWVRWDGHEFPLFSHHEYGTWQTPSIDFQDNIEENHISEAFTEGVARLPDGEYGGWCGFEEDTWEEMSEAEQFIAHMIRDAIVEMKPPDDPRWIVLEICQQKLGIED